MSPSRRGSRRFHVATKSSAEKPRDEDIAAPPGAHLDTTTGLGLGRPAHGGLNVHGQVFAPSPGGEGRVRAGTQCRAFSATMVVVSRCAPTPVGWSSVVPNA